MPTTEERRWRNRERIDQESAWPRPRFTIRSLLIATTIIAALSPAAWFAWLLLLNASTAWGTHAVLGTALLLALAAAVAIERQWCEARLLEWICRGRLRVFPLRGVRRCGRGAAVLLVRSREPRHDATQSLGLPRTCPANTEAKFGACSRLDLGSRTDLASPSDEDFDQVAHLLWTLLFAVVGGSISLLIWAIGRRRIPRGADDERV